MCSLARGALIAAVSDPATPALAAPVEQCAALGIANLAVVDLAVGAVAIGRVCRALAHAQKSIPIFLSGEYLRCEICSAVAAVAEGLLAGKAARTIKICLAFFQQHLAGLVICYNWLAHWILSF